MYVSSTFKLESLIYTTAVIETSYYSRIRFTFNLFPMEKFIHQLYCIGIYLCHTSYTLSTIIFQGNTGNKYNDSGHNNLSVRRVPFSVCPITIDTYIHKINFYR